MNYQAWAEQHLTPVSLHELGKVTTAWMTKESDKPIVVMVHGIGGDYSGLVPLAVELADTYRIIIVDLPGHGRTDAVRLPNAVSLRRWFEGVLAKVRKDFGKPALVIGHSFGCSAVIDESVLKKYKVVLLNPVPTPSEMYARYARAIMHSASLWAYVYNWRFLIYLRGRALIKVHTKPARLRVKWVGLHSKPTYTQTVFQAGLVDMILDGSAYKYVGSGKVALVLCGLYDTTARERDYLEMRTVFGDTRVIFLKGGHLLPIESPERVAQVIKAVIH